MNPFKTIYTVEKDGKVFILHWKNRYDPTGGGVAGAVGGPLLGAQALKIGFDAGVLPTIANREKGRSSTRDELGDLGGGPLGSLLTGIFEGFGGSVIGTGEMIGSFLATGKMSQRKSDLVNPFSAIGPTKFLQDQGVSDAAIGTMTEKYLNQFL